MRIFFVSFLVIFLSAPVHGARNNIELTRSIQRDLQTLGYDIDNVRGDLTMQTRIVIGAAEEKYQMPITGEPSFELAAKTKANVYAQENPAPVADIVDQTAVAGTTNIGVPASEVRIVNPLAPDAACLQQHVDANSTGSGGSIAAASARILRRYGNKDVVDTVNTVSHTAADVVATTSDVETIASELDLTEDQVRSCM